MRILAVDDNLDIIELVRRVLTSVGHEVILARDGIEALQQYTYWQPDLVVCDVNLPGIDGWEVCRRIKSVANTPIILLTVRVERVDLDHSHAVGADAHIAKPFDITEFIDVVERLGPRYY